MVNFDSNHFCKTMVSLLKSRAAATSISRATTASVNLFLAALQPAIGAPPSVAQPVCPSIVDKAFLSWTETALGAPKNHQWHRAKEVRSNCTGTFFSTYNPSPTIPVMWQWYSLTSKLVSRSRCGAPTANAAWSYLTLSLLQIYGYVWFAI